MTPGERSVPGRWIVIGIVVVSSIMIAILGSWLFTRPRSAPAPPPSIAVLPFADLSPEKNQQYYGDGVSEQIIDTLNHIPDFHVVPRASAFALKGKPQEVRDIGRQFNVRSVLQGTVQRSGTHLHITADLVNTSDGFHLSSKTFDRDTKDIFALEDEIVNAIVETLDLKPAAPLPKTPVRDLAAYDLYLQGREAYFQWQAERAAPLYQQAIEKDPGYASAFAGLAEAYISLGFSDASAMPKARAAAQKALALDDHLDAAHVVLAEVDALYDHDWDASQNEFARAATVNAHVAHALTYLTPLGQTKEAIEEIKRALQVDPLNPVLNTGLGFVSRLDRQSDAGSTPVQDAAFPPARGLLSKDAPVTTKFQRACEYAGQGDKTRALDKLEESYNNHEALLVFSKTWPALDPLRSEPRFQALLAKLHLSPADSARKN